MAVISKTNFRLSGNLNTPTSEDLPSLRSIPSPELAGGGAPYPARSTTARSGLGHLSWPVFRSSARSGLGFLLGGSVHEGVSVLGRAAELSPSLFPAPIEIDTSRSGMAGLERKPRPMPYLAFARSLLDRDQIEAARLVLGLVPLEAVENEAARRLSRLLAPPRITATPVRDVDRACEYRWLQDNWQSFRGQWIALDGDTVLASGASLKELRERLTALRLTRPPLVHRID
jgi:hypothetical protein